MCPPVAPQAGHASASGWLAGGHVQSLCRGVGILGLCPLAASKVGHARPGALGPWDMSSLRAGGSGSGGMSVLGASGSGDMSSLRAGGFRIGGHVRSWDSRTGGHAQSSCRAVGILGLCPLVASKVGHAQIGALGPGDMSIRGLEGGACPVGRAGRGRWKCRTPGQTIGPARRTGRSGGAPWCNVAPRD